MPPEPIDSTNPHSIIITLSVHTDTMAAASAAPVLDRSIINRGRRIRTEVSRKSIGWMIDRYADPEAADYDYDKTRLRVPPYQRRWSWTAKRGLTKQRDLIDSILHGYPIPAVIVNQTTDDDDNDHWDIYDGRHRIETVWRFYHNRFGLTHDAHDAPIYYKDLCERDQEKFLTAEFPMVSTEKANNEQLAEIFIRLNSGASLKDKDLFWANADKALISDTIKIITDNAPAIESALKVDLRTKTKIRPQLHNWVGLIHGLTRRSAAHMTTSYIRISPHLDEVPDNEVVNDGLQLILALFEKANDLYPMEDKIIKKGAKLGFVMAFFFHDFVSTDPDTDEGRSALIDKWAHAIGHVRRHPESTLLTTVGAQNLNARKVEQVVSRVNAWVDGDIPDGVPVGYLDDDSSPTTSVVSDE